MDGRGVAAWRVAREQVAAARPNDVLGQRRDGPEIGRRADIVGPQADPVEQLPVVGNLPVCMPYQGPELLVLVAAQLFLREAFGAGQEMAITADAEGVEKPGERKIGDHAR